ncbi:hypothetical protein LCGC14_2014800 [marine sediment metagenome]|uniref:HNH endonuclease n=1 Tax=marine sediment metagenome TaxID=412755 RepID=A0A0F9EZA0_9ZZZZ
MKICNKCNEEKPLNEFNRKSANADGLERYCKDCHRIVNRAHYRANKQAYKDRAKKNRLALRSWYKELKSTYKCLECDENKPWRLTFHHTDPSKKN